MNFMPKLFKRKCFSKQGEKSSEELRKKEKALELIREIRMIKERMKKQGENKGGCQRIVELTKEIEKLFFQKFLGMPKKRLLKKIGRR